MRIWVDADACPRAIKEILYRAADRRKIPLTLVANRSLRVPSSPYVEVVRVAQGFDVADHRIVQDLQPGDVVITADVPLAAAVLERGGHALGPRGERFTTENIHDRLAMRDLLDHLRSTGIQTGGPDAWSTADRQAFANGLDRILTRAGAR